MERSPRYVKVALDLPEIGQNEGFDYGIPEPLIGRIRLGNWLLVPWINSKRVGLAVGLTHHSEVDPKRLRSVDSLLADAPEPDRRWLQLLTFAATYYHRTLGEVAIPSIPKLLRKTPKQDRSDKPTAKS